jgi:autotransporter translocation and assembly factor TamB
VLADRGWPWWLAWVGGAISLVLLALCVVGGLALWHHGLHAVTAQAAAQLAQRPVA